MASDTKTLIERLEAADGPDQELDDAIATLLFEDKHRTCIEGLTDEAGGMWVYRYPNGSIGSALRFTSSIDAALTLAENGDAAQILDEARRLIGLHGWAGRWRDALPRFICIAALLAKGEHQ